MTTKKSSKNVNVETKAEVKKESGAKVESKRRVVAIWALGLTLTFVLGLIIGSVATEPMIKVLPTEPNGVEAKRVLSVLYKERKERAVEKVSSESEIVSLNGEIDSLQDALNFQEREVANKLLAQEKRHREEMNAKIEALKSPHDVEIVSLKEKVSLLEKKVSVLRDENSRMVPASCVDALKRELEIRDAENEELEKMRNEAIRQKNEAIQQKWSTSGIPGVKDVSFSPDERIRILNVNSLDSFVDGMKVVEVQGKVMSCGNSLSFVCWVPDNQAKLLKIGKVLKWGSDVLVSHEGSPGYYFFGKFHRKS